MLPWRMIWYPMVALAINAYFDARDAGFGGLETQLPGLGSATPDSPQMNRTVSICRASSESGGGVVLTISAQVVGE